MNFLLNMNVNRDMAVQLRKRGHICRHVGDIGMSRAKDIEIVAEAKRLDVKVDLVVKDSLKPNIGRRILQEAIPV